MSEKCQNRKSFVEAELALMWHHASDLDAYWRQGESETVDYRSGPEEDEIDHSERYHYKG